MACSATESVIGNVNKPISGFWFEPSEISNLELYHIRKGITVNSQHTKKIIGNEIC